MEFALNDRGKWIKSSLQDSAEGMLHRAMGSGKEIAGTVMGNRRLMRKGRAEKRAGKIQEQIGQMKKVLAK